MVAPPESSDASELRLSQEEKAEIKDKGRWMRRVVNPFVDFYVIVTIGAAGSPTAVEATQRREDRQVRDHAKDLTPIQRKIYAEDFQQIIENLPFVKTRLESDDPSRVIRKIAHKVQSVADQAKQSDTKGIKQGILDLIPREYLPPRENGRAMANAHECISIKNPGLSKSWRGWGTNITARLLCPIDYVAQFKENPDDTREKLSQGELTLVDNTGDPKLPAYLYDEDIADGSLTQGLLRGQFLLAVYISIFISPSAATGAKASSKRGNAKIHGMEKVLPSTICYAAIHGYIGLCACKVWGEEWKGVKLTRLYLILREQFAHADDPWCTETLKWWNENIFSGSAETDENSQEMVQDTQGPSLRERIDNERQERMRAAAGN